MTRIMCAQMEVADLLAGFDSLSFLPTLTFIRACYDD